MSTWTDVIARRDENNLEFMDWDWDWNLGNGQSHSLESII